MIKGSRDGSSLLRDVTVHAQRRTLERPGRAAPVELAIRPASQSAMCLPLVAAPAANHEQVYDSAHARGMQEGREAGLQQGLKEAQLRIDEAVRAALATAQAKAVREAAAQAQQWTEGLRRLDSLAGEFEHALQLRLDDLEAHAVTLAFETVCCLLGDRAQRLPLVRDLVSQGMAKLRGQPLRLRLNGQDLALLDTLAPTEGLRDRYPQIEWVADAGVVCGGCLIDTVAGTLDARLDSQLKRLLELWRAAGLPVALPGRVEE